MEPPMSEALIITKGMSQSSLGPDYQEYVLKFLRAQSRNFRLEPGFRTATSTRYRKSVPQTICKSTLSPKSQTLCPKP